MACNSVEIRFFILITKEVNEGISLVFILGRCDFLLFANTKINKQSSYVWETADKAAWSRGRHFLE